MRHLPASPLFSPAAIQRNRPALLRRFHLAPITFALLLMSGEWQRASADLAKHGLDTEASARPNAARKTDDMAAPLKLAAVKTWNGGVGDWFLASNWTPSGVPASDDVIQLHSGTLVPSQPVVHNGEFLWTGGVLRGSVTIGPNGGLTLANIENRKELRGSLTNAGTIRFMSGDLYLNGISGSGKLINLPEGTVDFQTDNSFITRSGTYTSETFLNQGTVLKTGGDGETSINAALTNDGTLEVRRGAISLNQDGSSDGKLLASAGATLVINDNFIVGTDGLISGDGMHLLKSGTLTLRGRIASSNLVLAGGILSGTSGSIEGLVMWSGTRLSGSLTLASKSILTLVDANRKDLHGSLTNAGTIRLTAGDLYLNGISGSGKLINLPEGTVDFQTDNSFITRSGTYATETFLNQGTVLKTGGVGETSINAALTNDGTLEVRRGAISLNQDGSSHGKLLASAGATLVINDNFIVGTDGLISGDGMHLLKSGTLTLRGRIASSNLVLAGGILSGTSGSIEGLVMWSGTRLSGSLMLASKSILTLVDANRKDLHGSLTNAGTIRLTAGDLYLNGISGSGKLINLPEGVVDFQSDSAITRSGTYASETFLNHGLTVKSGGEGTASIDVSFTNSGNLQVNRGTLALTDGGNGSGQFLAGPGATLLVNQSYILEADGLFAGEGTHTLRSGTFTLRGTMASSNLLLESGIISGSNGALNGAITWIGTRLNGTITLGQSSVLTLSGPERKDLHGTLTNAGTIDFNSGNLYLNGISGAGKLVNLPGASVHLKSDVSITRSGTYASESFQNQGTVIKSDGEGIAIVSVPFTGSGGVEVLRGTVRFTGSSFSMGSGHWACGIRSATDFGRVSFAGRVTFQGNFVARLLDDYEPVEGTVFPLISYSTHLSAFAQTTLPAGYNWQTNYAATQLELKVTGLTLPVIQRDPVSMALFTGQTARFEVQAAGAALSYQWFKGIEPLVQSTDRSLVIPNITAADAGEYRVTVSNSAGSVSSQPALLTLRVLNVAVQRSADQLVLEFPATDGLRFQLQSSAALEPDSWRNVGEAMVASGPLHRVEIPIAPAFPQQFYRVVLQN